MYVQPPPPPHYCADWTACQIGHYFFVFVFVFLFILPCYLRLLGGEKLQRQQIGHYFEFPL